MKRLNSNTIERIADINNLHEAYVNALKHKRWKRRDEIAEFAENFEENINALSCSIREGTVQLCGYYRFWVTEPKRRLVCAAPFVDILLHHAIINVIQDRIEKHLINETFACRVGKGVDTALYCAQRYSNKFKWYVKLDVCKYFDSINHLHLIKLLERIIKCERTLSLLWQIIASYHSNKGEGIGIPIGNLTSQFFANFFLSPMDHYIKETLRIGGLVRYMDDFLMFDNDLPKLQEAIKSVEKFLEGIDLKLHEPVLNKTAHGIPFLGYNVLPNKYRLLLKTKRRSRQKIKIANAKLKDDDWNQEEFALHVQPIMALLGRAKSKGFTGSML